MSQHTRGPWFAEMREADRGGPDWLVVFPDGEDASVLNEANARLIAAAPDLLAALQAAAVDHGGCDYNDCWCNAASAAIRKATAVPEPSSARHPE